VTDCGYKSALVLTPAITMQHIGLTSTIDGGADRNWAPATAWDNPSKAIPVPYFDFDAWEASHHTDAQKDFAISTLTNLQESLTDDRKAAVQLIIDELTAYTPGQGDVELPNPKGNSTAPGTIIRRDAGKRIVAPGTTVRRPHNNKTKRVIVRKARAK